MEKSTENWRIAQEKERWLQEILEKIREKKAEIPRLFEGAETHIAAAEFYLRREDGHKKVEDHLRIAMALLEEIKTLRLF